jgi:sigma-B regulation protein RsbU (phosphoserine phosphatase)
MSHHAHLISQVALFRTLPASEHEYLADTLHTVDIPAGTYLFSEGERGSTFYIIVTGHLEVIKALGTPEETRLAVRGPGEFLGEMSLLNPDGLRTASVRTVGDVRLIEMSRADFEALLHRQPMLAYEMVRVLSSRLTVSHNEAIIDLQAKNQELQRAYDELKAAQEQLVEKERLERELQVARQIQMSILPQHLPELPGFDFGALMSPARAVGGDFFGLFTLGQGRVGVAIGDVTDKGVPAAIFMAQTHALLRAEAGRNASPRKTLQRVNRLLMEVNSGGLFVTILYGVLDQQTRQFDYVRAGHELPMLRSSKGEISLAPQGRGMPLAIFDDPMLDENQITLPPGSTLLLYTDGVTDAQDTQHNAFGLSRLEAALKEIGELGGQAVCDGIFQAVGAYQSSAVQFDDVTLVAVQAMG